MQMQTAEIADGVRYTEILDSRFRGCLLTLHFALRRNETTAPVHALLTDLLTGSSADYPAPGALSAKLDSLYAADFPGSLTLCGDASDLYFSASWLDDAYALNGESVTGEMLSLVKGCLFRPHLGPDGAFDAERFRICRQNLLDDIDAAVNDKRAYALRRAAETAFAGEPAAIPPQGSRAFAETVTAADCAVLWQEILRTAPVDLIAVLPHEKPFLRELLTAAFSGIGRAPVSVSFSAPSPIRQQTGYVTEEMDMIQSRIVLTYLYDDVSRAVMTLLCRMLSGTGSSLLFANVREQQGLCYDCSASFSAAKHALVIECGVRPGMEQAAQTAITEQITALQTGSFPADLPAACCLAEEFSVAAAQDSAGGIARTAAAAHRAGLPYDPAERLRQLRAVTPEQISEAAGRLRLISVYRLCGREEGGRTE